MPAAEKNGPEFQPTPSPPRPTPGSRRLRYRTLDIRVLIVAGVPLTTALLLTTLFGRVAFLIVLAILCLVLVWQRGITIDTEKRTLTEWSGPFFPLVWTRYRLDWFDAVAVVTDTFEIHDRYSNTGALFRRDPRRYGSEVSLKLIARLTPETRYPEELPRPLKIPLSPLGAPFGSKTLQEEGRKLAEAIGFPFMDVR